MSEVPVAQNTQTPTTQANGAASPATTTATTQNCAIDVSDIRTVRVSNISLRAAKADIREFFSYTGDILHVEVQRESEMTQLAYVTFKDSGGADRAILLSGATIGSFCVTIKPVENYQLPPDVCLDDSEKTPASNLEKAEDMVSTMLARGFVLGKDAVKQAKDFDEKHQFSSNASARVVSLDRQLGLSLKLRLGKAVVNEKAREVDERYQVLEKTKTALQAAEQTANNAGTAVMRNQYVQAGASWFTSVYGVVVKAAEDLNTRTQEKIEKAEEERKEGIVKEKESIGREFADAESDLDDGSSPVAPRASGETKLETMS